MPISLCDQLEQMVRSLSTLQQSVQQSEEQLTRHHSESLRNSTETVGLDRKAIELVWQQSTDLLPHFLEILEKLESADIAPQTEQQIRPYQTEAHRRLRLIKVEAMRLRTARQPMTVRKSYEQLTNHVAALQQFAEAIAREICA